MDRTKFLDWLTAAYAQARTMAIAVDLSRQGGNELHALSPAHVFRVFAHHALFEETLEEVRERVEKMPDTDFELVMKQVRDGFVYGWEDAWLKTVDSLMPIRRRAVPEMMGEAAPWAPPNPELPPEMLSNMAQVLGEARREGLTPEAAMERFINTLPEEERERSRAFTTVFLQAARRTHEVIEGGEVDGP